MKELLLETTHKWKVDTVSEVEQLHKELQADTRFLLTAFSYKTKETKEEEYQIVTAKLVFNGEKEEIQGYVKVDYIPEGE